MGNNIKTSKMNSFLGEGMFSPKGRRGRIAYFWTSIILNGVAGPIGKYASNGYGFAIILNLLLMYLVFTNASKRLHDMNMPGWVALIFALQLIDTTGELRIFIIVAAIALGVFLIFKKGTVGDNPYGSDPLSKGD